MAAPSIKVEGANELRRALRGVRVEGLGKQLGPINKSAAQIVAQDALPHVPVGATGRLKASVRALGSQKAGRVRAGSAKVDYAAAIHWGRKRGWVWGGREKFSAFGMSTMRARRGHMGPNVITGRPFLWDAAQRRREAVVDEYRAGITKLIDRAVRGR